jgi:hypothetical protein
MRDTGTVLGAHAKYLKKSGGWESWHWQKSNEAGQFHTCEKERPWEVVTTRANKGTG